MANLNDARRAVSRFSGRFRTKRTEVVGKLGNGSGLVNGTRPNHVWVRIGGSPAVEVFNVIAPPVENLDVVVSYANDQSSLMEIIGLARSAAGNQDLGHVNMALPHAANHMYNHPDASIKDIVYIQKRVIVPLLVIPTSTASMSVQAYADFYPYGSSWKYFAGGTSPSMASYVPPSDFSFALVYINGETNALSVMTGASFTYFDTKYDKIPTPPPGSVPLAAVMLYAGMTEIKESDIYDLRLIYNTVGGGSTPAFHPTGLVPMPVMATGISGSSIYPARQDHVHAHGNQAGGLLHATATLTSAGFMPAVDGNQGDVLTILAAGVPGWSTPASSGGSGGGGGVRAIARFYMASGESTAYLPDIATDVFDIKVAGVSIDPVLYSYDPNTASISLDNPINADGTIVVVDYEVRTE